MQYSSGRTNSTARQNRHHLTGKYLLYFILFMPQLITYLKINECDDMPETLQTQKIKAKYGGGRGRDR